MNMATHPNNSQANEQKPIPGKQHCDQLWNYLKLINQYIPSKDLLLPQ